MKSILKVVAVISLLALVSNGPVFAAEIILTPGGATSIQAAVTAVTSGDTITLSDGVYFKDGDSGVDFQGKAITIRSQNGAQSVTVDCQGDTVGFLFTSGEGSSSVLENITIDAGFSNSAGAGIYISSSSPTIRGCVVQNCTSLGEGGGIYIERQVNFAAPSIENCEISGCLASANGGGVMITSGANPIITQSLIHDNDAANGAGVFLDGNGGLTLDRSTIYSNTASVDGGGLFATGGDAGINMFLCIFYDNSAQNGGGMRLQSATANVDRCTIAENSASANGSGVSLSGNATFSRVIVANNTSSAGFSCGGGTVTVTGCMLVGGHTTNLDGSCFSGTIIEEDPQFCGIPGSRNYQLQSDSPAAGNEPGCSLVLGAEIIGCATSPTRQSTWGQIKAMYQ